jgi:hypothetical protein
MIFSEYLAITAVKSALALTPEKARMAQHEYTPRLSAYSFLYTKLEVFTFRSRLKCTHQSANNLY